MSLTAPSRRFPPLPAFRQHQSAGRLLLPLTTLISLVIAACGTLPPPSNSTALHVLATETFLGDIAQNVAGDRLHVDTLLPPGVDPHEFQPAPQDAIKIAQSRLLIVNGLGYETWLSKSIQDGSSQQVVVVATQGLTPLPDPSGAAVYAANAASYSASLNDLDRQIKAQVASLPPEKRLLVTNHDSLGYFAQAYGFKVIGAIVPSITSESSPSAQQMAALIDVVKSSHAPAIFLDASENSNLARQIASETGAKVVTDLYVETLSPPSGPAPTYIDMLHHDLTSILSALQ